MQQSELDGGRDCSLGGADADARPTGELAMRARALAVDAGLVNQDAEDGLLSACEVLSDLGRQPAGSGEAAAAEERGAAVIPSWAGDAQHELARSRACCPSRLYVRHRRPFCLLADHAP